MIDARQRARLLSRRMELLIHVLMGAVLLFTAYGLWVAWSDPEWAGLFILDRLALPKTAQPSETTVQLLIVAFLTQAGLMLWALHVLRRAFREISLHDIVSTESARLMRLSGTAFLLNATAMVLAPPLVSLIVSLDLPAANRFLTISFSTAELLALIVSGTLIVFGHLLAVAAEVDDDNRHII
ncbi:MAG: hypothetical protein F9K19_05475 [Rhizobiaceae bacterium]|nr:MAG: hypothetical protein F9K19_05475 [Rhizobiaceae bacterium]CAG0980196.1 hypothetical protein RHIZO_01695 [Rhizobiaceae bacterium]